MGAPGMDHAAPGMCRVDDPSYGARGVLRTMELPGSTERLYFIPDVEKLAVQRAARVAS